jgi:hypothetical protein
MKLHWSVLYFAATFAVYAALIPRVLLYSSPPTGDQAYYLMEAISLVQDLDFNVAVATATLRCRVRADWPTAPTTPCSWSTTARCSSSASNTKPERPSRLADPAAAPPA